MEFPLPFFLVQFLPFGLEVGEWLEEQLLQFLSIFNSMKSSPPGDDPLELARGELWVVEMTGMDMFLVSLVKFSSGVLVLSDCDTDVCVRKICVVFLVLC